MTQTNHADNVLGPIFQPMLDFWNKYIEQSAGTYQGFVGRCAGSR